MSFKELKVWEILVPMRNEMGLRIDNANHYTWDEKVIKITGGLTIMRSLGDGKWLEKSGIIIKEAMVPVRIACTNAQIEQIMEITKEHYQQEAVFAMLISNQALILE